MGNQEYDRVRTSSGSDDLGFGETAPIGQKQMDQFTDVL